jgi:hypothetical protein
MNINYTNIIISTQPSRVLIMFRKYFDSQKLNTTSFDMSRAVYEVYKIFLVNPKLELKDHEIVIKKEDFDVDNAFKKFQDVLDQIPNVLKLPEERQEIYKEYATRLVILIDRLKTALGPYGLPKKDLDKLDEINTKLISFVKGESPNSSCIIS